MTYTDQNSSSHEVRAAFSDIYGPQRGTVHLSRDNRIVVFFDETQTERDVPDSILVAVSDRTGVPVRDIPNHLR